MNRFLCAALAASLLFAPFAGNAQTYRDIGGTVLPAIVEAPFPYKPMAGAGQHNIAPTSATSLTVPAGARYAVVCASGASTILVKWTTDGETPSATVGMPMLSGVCVPLYGPAIIAAFQAYSAAGTLDVEYYQ